MTFAHPAVLLLLAVPVLLLVVPPARRVGVVLPFDHLAHPRRRVLGWTLAAFDRVPALILAAVIAMLAGPQVLRTPGSTRLLTNIQFALDVSGSMGSEDRSVMARKAIEEFTIARQGDAFGLTLFGSMQIRWIPLTTDLKAIRNALPFGDPAHQPVHMGGTMIGAALRFCRDNMNYEATRGDRIIILVSDGQSGDFGDGTEQDVARELKEAGITLFHVHVGSDEMPQEVVELARQTGGEAFAARDSRGLERIFQRIDQMKPAQFAPGGTIPMPFDAPFALAALGLLGLHLVGLMGIRITPW
ncbi:MAG: vWA domain-containing protein [Phycisphaerales bacterium]